LPAALQAVQTLQAGLSAALPGLRCAVLQRVDAAAQPTLMETYAAAGGINSATQRQIEQAALQATGCFVRGTRHVEVFEPR